MPPGLRWAKAWLVACAVFVLLGIAALGFGGRLQVDERLDVRAGLMRALGLSTLALEPAATRLRAPEGAPNIDRRFTPAVPDPGSSGEGRGGQP